MQAQEIGHLRIYDCASGSRGFEFCQKRLRSVWLQLQVLHVRRFIVSRVLSSSVRVQLLDAKCPVDLETTDGTKSTALHVTAVKGTQFITQPRTFLLLTNFRGQDLLHRKASIDKLDNEGFTALMRACHHRTESRRLRSARAATLRRVSSDSASWSHSLCAGVRCEFRAYICAGFSSPELDLNTPRGAANCCAQIR